MSILFVFKQLSSGRYPLTPSYIAHSFGKSHDFAQKHCFDLFFRAFHKVMEPKICAEGVPARGKFLQLLHFTTKKHISNQHSMSVITWRAFCENSRKLMYQKRSWGAGPPLTRLPESQILVQILAATPFRNIIMIESSTVHDADPKEYAGNGLSSSRKKNTRKMLPKTLIW